MRTTGPVSARRWAMEQVHSLEARVSVLEDEFDEEADEAAAEAARKEAEDLERKIQAEREASDRKRQRDGSRERDRDRDREHKRARERERDRDRDRDYDRCKSENSLQKWQGVFFPADSQPRRHFLSCVLNKHTVLSHHICIRGSQPVTKSFTTPW